MPGQTWTEWCAERSTWAASRRRTNETAHRLPCGAVVRLVNGRATWLDIGGELYAVEQLYDLEAYVERNARAPDLRPAIRECRDFIARMQTPATVAAPDETNAPPGAEGQ